MGVTRTDLDDDMQELSDGMAEAFAEYINDLGLKDSDGNILALTESESGVYQAGSYYDYVKSEIERSLNNFLSDTTFPYTQSSGGKGKMIGAGGFGRGGFGDGYQTSNVATYWRIRTGITQGDTALSTELNLTLALENYGRDVDFETIWGAGHTMAERTGNSTENFIEWVDSCLK
jgi:hypothetical protein